jgi:hypothetical protein
MVHRRCVFALAMFVALMTGITTEFRVFAQSRPQGKTAPTKTTVPGLSGTWSLVATFKGPPGLPDGGFRATVTFKQRNLDESKPVPLDGYLTYPNGSGGAFTGIVNNRAVTFTTVFKDPDRPGVTRVADFTGTLDGDGTIKGHVINVSTGPGTYMRGEGPFVATRGPTPPRR